MTRITFDPGTRALLKRFFGKSSFLFVNANGDISDLETVISHQRAAEPRGTWHVIRDHIPGLIAANQLVVTEDAAVVQINGRSVDVLADQHGETFDHAPAFVDPEEHAVTLRATDGHNHVAMKSLRSAASALGSPDGEAYGISGLRLHGWLPDGDNPALHEGDYTSASVVGIATDRYQAVVATFEAEPAPVDAVVEGRILAAAGSRADWTLTVTDKVTAVTFEKLGVTVTSPNFTEREYPHVLRLFAGEEPKATSLTARPRDFRDALDALPKKENVVLTSDGTVYADGGPEVPIAGVVGERGESTELLPVNPTFLRRQLVPLGARWPAVTVRWTKPQRRMSVDCGRGIVGLVMPLAPRVAPPRPGSTEAVA